MQHIFLFALALTFTIFATIQDIKKREVANWLNFSLIAFALAYKAFYSIENFNTKFFLLGVSGFAVCAVLGNAFYYSKVFAGGDAKLLMAIGAILPYSDYFSLITLTFFFIFLLISIGAIYSLIYSVFIAVKSKNKFSKEFKKLFNKNKSILLTSFVILLVTAILSVYNSLIIFLSILSLTPILIIYTKSVEKCMTVLLLPSKLTEGDWIEQDIHIGKSIVKKTVHGLSKKDIQLLRKYKKSITVKQGIPFVPAFLISLIILIILFTTNKMFFLNSSIFLS